MYSDHGSHSYCSYNYSVLTAQDIKQVTFNENDKFEKWLQFCSLCIISRSIDYVTRNFPAHESFNLVACPGIELIDYLHRSINYASTAASPPPYFAYSFEIIRIFELVLVPYPSGHFQRWPLLAFRRRLGWYWFVFRIPASKNSIAVLALKLLRVTRRKYGFPGMQ